MTITVVIGLSADPATHILTEDRRAYCGAEVMIHGGLNTATCDECIRLAAAAEGITRCAGCGWFHDERTAWYFHGPDAATGPRQP